MTVTNVTVLTELRSVFNDIGGVFFSSDAYNNIVIKGILEPEKSYNFIRKSTGVYSLGANIWIYGAAITTEQEGVDYTLSSSGTILVTTGEDTRKIIPVTGSLIDFPGLVIEAAKQLISRHSVEGITGVSDDTYIPPEPDDLERIIKTWQNLKIRL